MLLKHHAFTLIEVLLSMLILTILISFSCQNYNQFISRQTLVSNTQQLYLFLKLAQSHAIKYNQKIYVHFCQSGNTTAWNMAQSDQSSCDCFNANHCLVGGVEFNEVMSDGQAVFINANEVTFSGQQASYNALRFSVNSGSIILNDHYGHRLKVIQSAMRLKICSPDSDQLGYPQC